MSTPTIPKEDATMSDLEDAKMEVEEDWRARRIRESSCGGNGGAGCNSQWCADCKQEEEVRDYLDEAERIVKGESRLLPERAHLEALVAARKNSRKVYFDIADAIAPSSAGPDDLIAKVRALRTERDEFERDLRSAGEDGAEKAFTLRVGEFALTEGNKIEASGLNPGYTTVISRDGFDVCEKGRRAALVEMFSVLDDYAAATRGREMGNG